MSIVGHGSGLHSRHLTMVFACHLAVMTWRFWCNRYCPRKSKSGMVKISEHDSCTFLFYPADDPRFGKYRRRHTNLTLRTLHAPRSITCIHVHAWCWSAAYYPAPWTWCYVFYHHGHLSSG